MKQMFLEHSTSALIIVGADSIFYESNPNDYTLLISSVKKKELLDFAEQYWEDNSIPEDLRIIK